MNKQRISELVDRYISIFIHGSKSIYSRMALQLEDQLTFEQSSLLRMVRLHSPVRASELAELLFVHRSTITVNVNKLVEKGLIERQRDKNDRRNVFLFLSSEGEQLLNLVEANIEKLVAGIVEHLTEEEVESFLNTFEKIALYVEQLGGKTDEANH